MSRRSRSEMIPDVPSPSASSDGEEERIGANHIFGAKCKVCHQEVEDYGSLCVQLLGVAPHGKRPTTVRRTWLRDHMQIVPAEATELEVQRYTRAYILAMLGSSLLLDSSGICTMRVSPKRCKLSGCAILLQLWTWEHLITGRPRKLVVPAPPPSSVIDHMRLSALGYKWNVPKSFMQTSHHVLMLYRDLLDRQKANDVFGWRQSESALPLVSHKEMHMHIRRTTHLVDQEMQGYIHLWDNRAATIVTGEPDIHGSYLDANYSWYNTVTRKRIQSPLDTPEPCRP
ncbi:hypothetical protein QQ045_002368 [Rhodiola kirilowii]